MNEQVWEYERGRLSNVMERISRKLEEAVEARQKYREEVITIQKTMREEVNATPTDLDDLANIWQYQVDIDLHGKKYKLLDQQVKQLERLLITPYFGRIDFKEEGEELEEKIYIGVSGFKDERTGEYFVYDWRAPVSSMFYDYETGNAMYRCPSGDIHGEMLLKRQYRIYKGIIEYMFDSSIKIDDEMLQEILGRSADSKMKTIITSIQREQNRVIRDDTHRVLIVQGPAGSGKTSIALHRAAYLLYRHRDSISAQNIAVFSPNGIFSDYISNVLPELGEENIQRTTFLEYARKILGDTVKLEDMNRQMEYLLTSHEDPNYRQRVNGIAFKASPVFASILKAYIAYLESEGIVFDDIIVKDRIVISREEIVRLFRKDYAYLPVIKRLQKLRQRLLYVLEPLEKKQMEAVMNTLAESGEYTDKGEIKARSYMAVREQFRAAKESIERMTAFDPLLLYKKLFMDKKLMERLAGGRLPEGFDAMAAFTVERMKSRTIHYEDMVPLIYIQGVMGGLPDTSFVKHLIIDEMQDYSPLQLEIIKQLFKHCSITMLGDLLQSINPCMNAGSLQNIAAVFDAPGTAVLELTRSYRSTVEITQFSRAVLSEPVHGEFVSREGEKPEVRQAVDEAQLLSAVVEDVKRLKEQGYSSIAILCKTAQGSRSVFERIGRDTGAVLVTGEDDQYSTGVVVIPSYLSKGLEFDAVLVIHTPREGYERAEEMRLLYTVLTRALHVLHIYTTEPRPEFLKHVDSWLYRQVELSV